MTKFQNRWLRKIHRWLAAPTAILIPVAIIIKLAGSDPSIAFPPQLEQLQSFLLLTLAVSGAYLYLMPYIAKWQRQRRQNAKAKAANINRPPSLLVEE